MRKNQQNCDLTVRRATLLLPLDPTEAVLSSDAVRVVLRVDELGA